MMHDKEEHVVFKLNGTGNGDLSSWDTSYVTSMENIFEGALSLPDVSKAITRKKRRD
jgi:hypothetical protein